MTSTSVTIRLNEEHMNWIKSTEKSTSEAIRSAIEVAIRQKSYQNAAAVLENFPLNTEDEWGNLEEFMTEARPNEG